MEAVRKALEAKGYKITSAEVQMVPKTTVNLDEEAALKALRLIDRIEDLDDVQRVFSNADFSDAVLEKIHSNV
ncbi:MAG: YebC/PmpR family DNA-binding transcriptional regulator, partial [Chloroflexi bacterium]|nr:YebC/PmpR family DNA-binding transcriptional regulator [Chloroflexota bacterium]